MKNALVAIAVGAIVAGAYAAFGAAFDHVSGMGMDLGVIFIAFAHAVARSLGRNTGN